MGSLTVKWLVVAAVTAFEMMSAVAMITTPGVSGQAAAVHPLDQLSARPITRTPVCSNPIDGYYIPTANDNTIIESRADGSCKKLDLNGPFLMQNFFRESKQTCVDDLALKPFEASISMPQQQHSYIQPSDTFSQWQTPETISPEDFSSNSDLQCWTSESQLSSRHVFDIADEARYAKLRALIMSATIVLNPLGRLVNYLEVPDWKENAEHSLDQVKGQKPSALPVQCVGPGKRKLYFFIDADYC